VRPTRLEQDLFADQVEGRHTIDLVGLEIEALRWAEQAGRLKFLAMSVGQHNGEWIAEYWGLPITREELFEVAATAVKRASGLSQCEDHADSLTGRSSGR
jgi:hypothetical protein